MADDSTDGEPQNAKRLTPKQIIAVDFWKRAFGITENKLRALLDKLGKSGTKVRETLGKR